MTSETTPAASPVDPRRVMVDERWKSVQDVYLPVYGGDPDHPDGDCLYAPPSRVLSVCVVGDRAFVKSMKRTTPRQPRRLLFRSRSAPRPCSTRSSCKWASSTSKASCVTDEPTAGDIGR